MPLLPSIGRRFVAPDRLKRFARFRLVAKAAGFLLLYGISSLPAQETNPAIEQSRLYPRTIPPTAGDTSGGTLSGPQVEIVTSDDESFGAQQILKTQERIPEFFIGSTSTLYYTTNVALTRADTQPEGFFVGDVAFSWTPRLNSQLQFQLGGALGLFRYETSQLDFESLGAGTGIIWTPPNAWNLSFIGRYDFVELLDRHGDEILQDHQFSLAVQKVFVLGRSHALSVGVIGSLGVSDPIAEQRDQAGFAVAYHLQLTRNLGADLGYRHSWYFYNQNGRTDLNQVLSLGLHYNITPWLIVNGYVSGALNDSNNFVFDYDVFSAGGGVGLTFRF